MSISIVGKKKTRQEANCLVNLKKGTIKISDSTMSLIGLVALKTKVVMFVYQDELFISEDEENGATIDNNNLIRNKAFTNLIKGFFELDSELEKVEMKIDKTKTEILEDSNLYYSHKLSLINN